MAGFIVWLPAAILKPWMPADLACASWTGTVWRGACEGLSVRGSRSGTLRWDVIDIAFLDPGVTLDLGWRRDRSSASARLTYRGVSRSMLDVGQANIEVQTLRDALPADVVLGPLAALSGTLVAEDVAVEFDAEGPTSLRGAIVLRQARLLRPNAPIGDFEARLNERAVTLHDLGGPLAVTGRLALSGARSYRGTVRIEARSPSLATVLPGGLAMDAEIDGRF